MEVYGLFKSRRTVQEGFARLRAEGFLEDRISVIGPGEHPDIHNLVPSKLEVEREVRVTETSAALGAVSGVAGLAAGVAAAPGPLILLASGPILLALPLALWGAAMGGFIAFVLAQGVSLRRAETYAERVRAGETLVIFHPIDSDEAAVARRAMTMAGAEEVFCTSESEPPAPEA